MTAPIPSPTAAAGNTPPSDRLSPKRSARQVSPPRDTPEASEPIDRNSASKSPPKGRATTAAEEMGASILSRRPKKNLPALNSPHELKSFLEGLLSAPEGSVNASGRAHLANIQEAFATFIQAELGKMGNATEMTQEDIERVKWAKNLYQLSEQLFNSATTQQAELDKSSEGNLLDASKKKADIWAFVQEKQLAIQQALSAFEQAKDKHAASLEADHERLKLQKQAQEFNQKLEAKKLKAKDKQKEWEYLLKLQKLKADNKFDSSAPLDSPTNTFLHQVARSGDADMIELLLKAGLSKETKDSEGNTPLAHAVLAGKLASAKLLVSRTNVLGFKNHRQETLMHLAALSGNIQMINWVYQQENKTLNARDKEEQTPLFCAVLNNDFAAVKELHRLGADLTVVNNEAKNLLECALEHASSEIPRWLMTEAPHLVQKKDSAEGTPVTLAISRGHLDLAKEMLLKGGIFDPKNRANQRLLHRAANQGWIDTLRWLVQKGIPVDTLDEKGATPLLAALVEGELDAVKTLIELNARTAAPIAGVIEINGKRFVPETLPHAAVFAKKAIESLTAVLTSPADIELENKAGLTPIQVAVEKGLWRVAKFLVGQNARIDCLTRSDESLLHLAVRSGSLETVKWTYELMINQGKDVKALSREKMSPFKLSIALEFPEISQFLAEKTHAAIDPSFIRAWAKQGKKKPTLEWLLNEHLKAQGVEGINDADMNETIAQTPLQTACLHQNYEAADLLAAHMALPDIETTSGQTLWHLVLELNPPAGKWVRWLMRVAKSGVEQKNEADQTPLQKAVLKGYEQFAAILEREAKADTQVIDGQKQTLLHLAVQSGRKECVVYAFTKCKKQLEAQSALNETALQLSLRLGQHAITTYLVQQGATLPGDKTVHNYLFYAAQEGLQEIVDKILAKGVPLDTRDARGRTALDISVEYGRIDLALYLHQKRAFDSRKQHELLELILDIFKHAKEPQKVIEWLPTIVPKV